MPTEKNDVVDQSISSNPAKEITEIKKKSVRNTLFAGSRLRRLNSIQAKRPLLNIRVSVALLGIIDEAVFFIRKNDRRRYVTRTSLINEVLANELPHVLAKAKSIGFNETRGQSSDYSSDKQDEISKGD